MYDRIWRVDARLPKLVAAMENHMQSHTLDLQTTCFSSDLGLRRGRGFAHSIRGAAQSLVRRTRSFTSRFGGLGDEPPVSGQIEVSDSILHFQKALSDPSERDALRHQLKRERGTENLEFLLAFRSFEEAGNPLQRFQLLSHIVHNFVQDRAARQIKLSVYCQQRLVLELSRWSDAGRVPIGVQLAALEAAAAEVNMRIVALA
jgi:hypothetical protein